jgi:mono/diheme cytochrome c family protein
MMGSKWKILFCMMALVLATTVFVYADDDDEGEGEDGGGSVTIGGVDIPGSMVGTDCTECHGDKYANLVGATSADTGSATTTTTVTPPHGARGACNQCHGSKYGTNGTVTSAATATGGTSDGAALYQSYCGGCHGTLNSSDVKKSSSNKIKSAINENEGGMGKLSSLTSTQLQAITTALAGGISIPVLTPVQLPTVQPTPLPVYTAGPPDGASLYQVNCSSCHGPLSASSKRGATASAIQTAVTNNWGGMSYLAQLTLTQIQSISAVLMTVPAPTPLASGSVDGASLYQVNCANCHGAIATSAVKGATASSIQTAVNGNWGGMGYLSALTIAQIQAIAKALL